MVNIPTTFYLEYDAIFQLAVCFLIPFVVAFVASQIGKILK